MLTIKREHIAWLALFIAVAFISWREYFSSPPPTQSELNQAKDSATYYRTRADSLEALRIQDEAEYIALRQMVDNQIYVVENVGVKYVPIRKNIMRLNADSTTRRFRANIEHISVSDTDR